MSRFFGIVRASFRDHPFISNSVVYGTLFVAAECSQQIFTRKLMTQEPKPLDNSALVRFALFGTTIQGPLLYTWYKWLDRNFAGTAVKIVVKKVALDQFLMTPPLYVIFYVECVTFGVCNFFGMSGILRLIKSTFKGRPLLSNSVIYGSLYVAAECAQEVFERKIMAEVPKPIDSAAILRYAFFGTCLQGPFLYVWYKWLDGKYRGTTVKVVFTKLMIDQFLMVPPLYVFFYVVMNVMEGKKDVWEECKQKFMATYLSSCLFWLPAQSINFFMVPPSLRVVFVGCCAFIWVNILCWIKRQEY